MLKYNAVVPYWGPSKIEEEDMAPRPIIPAIVDMLFAGLAFVNAPITLGYALAPGLSGGLGVLAAWWLIGFAILPLVAMALLLTATILRGVMGLPRRRGEDAV